MPTLRVVGYTNDIICPAKQDPNTDAAIDPANRGENQQRAAQYEQENMASESAMAVGVSRLLPTSSTLTSGVDFNDTSLSAIGGHYPYCNYLVQDQSPTVLAESSAAAASQPNNMFGAPEQRSTITLQSPVQPSPTQPVPVILRFVEPDRERWMQHHLLAMSNYSPPPVTSISQAAASASHQYLAPVNSNAIPIHNIPSSSYLDQSIVYQQPQVYPLVTPSSILGNGDGYRNLAPAQYSHLAGISLQAPGTVALAPSSEVSTRTSNNLNSNGNVSRNFDDHFNALLEFKSVHGHCNVPRTRSADSHNPYHSLGIWVSNMRGSYWRMKRGGKPHIRITPSIIERLADIGFRWSLRVSFDEHLNDLTKFKAQFGHCNVPRDNEEHQSLVKWISNLKYSKKKIDNNEKPNMNLTPKKISLLTKLGLKWSD